MPPLAAPPATGYKGPPELTMARALTSWRLDVPMLVIVLLAAGCYLVAARRVRSTSQPWPVGRAVFAALGIGLLVVATMSWLGVYQDILFWVRAVQTILLLLLVPLLLALGRPITLLIAALPAPGRWVEAAIRGRAARILMSPLITTPVLIATPFVVYFTGWYAAALQDDLVRELTYLALIVPGFLFFWTLLRVDPVPRQYPYLVSLWVTGAEVVFDAFLGIAVIASQQLIAGGYYRVLARPWGPGPRTDQVLGGGALWILGDLVGLPFLAAMLIQMIKEDEADAAEIDARIDGQAAMRPPGAAAGAISGTPSAARAKGGPAGSLPTVAGSGPAPGQAGQGTDGGADRGAGSTDGDRPWWETDPRFVGRFHAAGPPRADD